MQTNRNWKNRIDVHSLRIFISCSLFYGAIIGIIVNCNGQFYKSIADSMGVSLGSVTASSAIMGITSLLCTPFVVKAYRKYNARLIVALTTILYTMGQMSIGFVTQLWQYYAVSMIKGACQGFLIFYLVSTLVKAWFNKRSGFALSFTAFFSGVIGIISNIMIGKAIDQAGWREAIIISSLVALVIALPAMCLFLYRSPGERQGDIVEVNETLPTEKTSNENAITGSRLPFYTGLLMAVIWIALYGYSQHLKIYAASVGFSQMIGAAMLSLNMAGSIAAKLSLSLFSDRIGAHKSAAIVLTTVTLAFAVFCLPVNLTFISVGAFLLGASTAFTPIIIPEVTSLVYQGRAFDAVYSKYSTVMSVIGAMWISILGSLYSAIKSYRPLFLIGLIMAIGSAVLLQIFVRSSNREKAEAEQL